MLTIPNDYIWPITTSIWVLCNHPMSMKEQCKFIIVLDLRSLGQFSRTCMLVVHQSPYFAWLLTLGTYSCSCGINREFQGQGPRRKLRRQSFTLWVVVVVVVVVVYFLWFCFLGEYAISQPPPQAPSFAWVTTLGVVVLLMWHHLKSFKTKVWIESWGDNFFDNTMQSQQG